MSDTTETTENGRSAWVAPRMEVVATTADIASGAIDVFEDFTGTPVSS